MLAQTSMADSSHRIRCKTSTQQISIPCLHPPRQLADSRQMSVQYKSNGTYYQIHFDLSKNKDLIKTFPKSDKDSIDDRIGLHGALKDSLRL
jgi:hypothetical protein